MADNRRGRLGNVRFGGKRLRNLMPEKNLQNNNKNNSNGISLTKEDILKTLDFEINQISSEQQRNGWTKWALYGVLAGSLWLLLEQWEKGNFDFNIVLILIVVFSIGLDILRQSQRLFPYRPSKYKKIPRFKIWSETGNKYNLFLHVVRHILIFVIALSFFNRVSWIQATLVLIYYGLFSILGLLAFGFQYFSLSDIIFDNKSKGSLKSYYTIWGITIIALAWGMIGYLNAALAYYPNVINVANFRVAGLLIVIGYSFHLLLDLSTKVPLLSRLTEIRRDLSFGRIDLKTAINQAEIIIAGILPDEKLQEDVDVLTKLVEERKLKFNKLYSEILTLSKEIPIEGANITDEQEKKAKNILLPCLDEIENLLKKNEEEAKLEKTLKIHVSMVKEEYPETVKAAEQFLKEIEKSDSEMTDKAELLLHDLLPMIEILKTKKTKQVNHKI